MEYIKEMYEGDKIDLEMKKQELWDLLQKL